MWALTELFFAQPSELNNLTDCVFKGKVKGEEYNIITLKVFRCELRFIEEKLPLRRALWAHRGKRAGRRRWRTSSLSVPYGLQGCGIVLFLGTNTLKCTHTPAERKQYSFPIPPVSSNPPSLHAHRVPTWAQPSLKVSLSCHGSSSCSFILIGADKLSHQTAASHSDRQRSLLQLSAVLSCVVTLTNSWCDSSSAPLACMTCTGLWLSEYEFL